MSSSLDVEIKAELLEITLEEAVELKIGFELDPEDLTIEAVMLEEDTNALCELFVDTPPMTLFELAKEAEELELIPDTELISELTIPVDSTLDKDELEEEPAIREGFEPLLAKEDGGPKETEAVDTIELVPGKVFTPEDI